MPTNPGTTDLLAYWAYDETSGTRADSHDGSYDLTDNNTVGYATGVVGNAASFDSASNEYLSLADDPAFSGLSAFTLSCWLYQPSSVATNRTIMSKWIHSTQTEFAIQTWDSGGEINMFAADSLLADGSIRGYTTDAGMSANTWYHVAVVYDGAGANNAARLKIYIDGVAATMGYSGTIPASLPDGTAPVEVGRFNNLGRYMHGRIDEMAMWSRALTADEVAWLAEGHDYADLSGTPPAATAHFLTLLGVGG